MRNREHGAVFRQSLTDFPCPVVLGKKSPSFGLHRYKQGLQFVPFDDEGFTLKGDKRRLLYQGRRRSHRFTILGDTSFEYDCILHKEPESNVVSFLIDGAEHFDFFRQPDFVKDPFLKGSYAVYKKQTLIGEGTGKLCHIHRPLIIDARGRRVWGTLAVIGNELRITIPEKWLSEAKYPVIVDPVVGTTTIGANTGYYEDFQEDYFDEDGEWIEFDNNYRPLCFYEGMAHNRYRILQDFYGTATAYVYLSMHRYSRFDTPRYYTFNKTIQPCIYSDNNNQPINRLSMNEGLFDHELNQTTKKEGWRSAPFTTNQVIDAGTYIWFGVNCIEYQPHFDYGAKSYICYIENLTENLPLPVPDIYPIEDCYDTYDILDIDNIRMSMYFNFTPMEHYVRTLTQGVKLTDTRTLTGNYKRSVTETAKINSVLSRFETILIKLLITVNNTMSINHWTSFIRNVIENITVTMANCASRSFTRKCREDVDFNSTIQREYGAICIVKDILPSSDISSVSLMYLRSVSDNVQLTHYLQHWWAIIRSLLDNVENTAETTHTGEFYRFNKDTLQAAGVVVRRLSMFVRIVSKIFIRDYLLGRFLIAREELKLKSAICREIILDSKID